MTKRQQVCAICGRPEETSDVISGMEVKNYIAGYLAVNFEVACLSSFRNHFLTAEAADIGDSSMGNSSASF